MSSERSGRSGPVPDSAKAYPALGGLRVVDAMHPGLISCSLETPLRVIARMLATYRVHAILVTTHGVGELAGGTPWGVVSDIDLLRASESADLDRTPARAVAATPVVMVTVDSELARAAELMSAHRVSHLIVSDSQSGQPVGVVSTLDIARALARFPERHPMQPQA
jgi:CBS domain-containing protein